MSSPSDMFHVGLKRFLNARLHYEMRSALDDCQDLRSIRLNKRISSILSSIPKEYRTVVVYQFRWARECYPFSVPITCACNQKAGAKGLIRSIGAAFQIKGDSRFELALWAAETEGAFVRARSLEAMREVALNYPILLRGEVLRGIDSMVKCELNGSEQQTCAARLRLLHQVGEDVVKRSVRSWWRSMVNVDEPSLGAHFD